MNRRDLLKKIAAAPIAAAVAPLAIANDGVALNSVAHPAVEGDFDTANMRYESHELSPQSLETVEIEIPEHEWDYRCLCIHCGASRLAVEDGQEPLACWSRLAARRHQALLDSFAQTTREWWEGPDAARIMGWPPKP